MSPKDAVDAVHHGMPVKTTDEDYPAVQAALVTARDWWALTGKVDAVARAADELARLDGLHGVKP